MAASIPVVERDVLVAVMNNDRDFQLARDEHWYRIPKESAEKWCARCWPPRWLVFYQTKVFGRESHSVTYFAEVPEIRQVRRCELFPDKVLQKGLFDH